MESRTDVVVIGGGLAGLVAAAEAARHGAAVILLDGRAIGGRARSVVREGFTLNEGAHALYHDGAALTALRALGVNVRGGRPDPSASCLVWDGTVVPLPSGPRALASTRILSAREKAKFAGWFAGARRHADRSHELSVGEWFDRERAGAGLRKLVLALMRLGTYTATPEIASADVMLRQLAMGAGGVLYVDGGWQAIVDGLVQVALSHGVRIVDHEPVVAVVEDAGGWAVGTASSTVHADAVVLAGGGPALATSLLGGDPAGWVERAGPIQRAAVLDVGGPPAGHRFLLSADEPLYLSTHAPVARLAPDGQHLVTLMRYRADADATPAAVDRAQLEAHAAMAGVAPPTERAVERFLAAPVVTWGTPLPDVERPTGHELAERGLFAAGDWVGRHLIADAAVASGRAAGAAASQRVAVRA